MADLARHLSITDRLVWMDMQIGPSGSPRPDVFTLQKSYSRPQPTAFECKISVSDFRSDITSGKWQSYLKFAESVTFCVPVGLVQKSDIPHGCGFMTRGPDGWYTHRRATRQVATLGTNQLMKLLIDGYGQELGQIELKRRDMRTAEASNKLAKKFGQHVADVIRDLAQAERMVDYYKERGEETRKRAEECANKIMGAQQEAWKDLAAVLDIPETCNRFEIERAIRSLSKPDQSDRVDVFKRGLAEIENITRRLVSA